MPNYICEKCGCIDNTALGFYWSRYFEDMWPDDVRGKALCCECAPTHYRNGEPTRFGKWHDKFPKKHWSEYGTKEKLISDCMMNQGNVVNAIEYFENYSNT